MIFKHKEKPLSDEIEEIDMLPKKKADEKEFFQEFIEIAGIFLVVSEETEVYYRVRYSEKTNKLKMLLAYIDQESAPKDLENEEPSVLNFIIKNYTNLLCENNCLF